MKKLILGMMSLIGIISYGDTTTIENSVKLSARAAGALNVHIVTTDIDFGNLRAYSDSNKTELGKFHFQLKDDKLNEKASTIALVTYTTEGLKNGDYVVEASVEKAKTVEVKNGTTNVYSQILLNIEDANKAPAGEYTGTLLIKAEYKI
ncbi:MAG: hypothetical protein ACRC5T_01655 [Cetobacterium sp.]